MNTYRIRLLGGLRAEQADRQIARFQTHKTGSLLAFLSFYRHRPHPREALIEILWPEDDPSSARHKLSLALSSLRRQLEPPGAAGAALLADRKTVQLNPRMYGTDVAEFETKLSAAAAGRGGLERAQLLGDAVELYQGELLPGYFEDWIEPERQRLAEAYLQVLSDLARLLEAAGDVQRAIELAQRAVSIDPLREEAHHDLMRLLVTAGRPEAALQQYRRLERLLEQELGAVPEACPHAAALLTEARRLQRDRAPLSTALPAHPPGHQPRFPLLQPTASARSAVPASGQQSRTLTLLLLELQGVSIPPEDGAEPLAELRRHLLQLFCASLAQRGGTEVRVTGDALIAAFPSAADALSAAVAWQRLLAESRALKAARRDGPMTPTGMALAVRARMALHTAELSAREGPGEGPLLHHTTRLLLAAHPGQVLVSELTAGLLRQHLEPGLHQVDLGFYRLRTGAAAERLFQVEYPEMPQRRFPPLNAARGPVGHLPLQLTRFFGREAELEQLRVLLVGEERRLVTLTGPGGSGKTRLALELAGGLLESFHGAVWFVSLADLVDGRLIADRIRDALRLPHTADIPPLEQVAVYLSGQKSLLILDNLEHLIEPGVPLVRTLLESAPALSVLVTSRQRLNLGGEQERTVLPLPVPVVPADTSPGAPDRAARCLETLLECASVRLFVDRAQAVRPDFQLTPHNAAAVVALCAQLEGIPLALELAAGRIGMLTPAQMLARIEQRFTLLTSRQQDAAPRHRSLWAALDSSYQLLSPELQRFFERLSVFRGGWTLAAAEAVSCHEARGERDETSALDYLDELRDRSLVVVEKVTAGRAPIPSFDAPLPGALSPITTVAEMRYRFLETVRGYAAEQLVRSGDEEATRARHVRFFQALAEDGVKKRGGAERLEWLERTDRDHDNLRAALAWALQAEPETALRLATGLGPFWQERGHWLEGKQWFDRCLAGTADSAAQVRAAALREAGRLLSQTHLDYRRAEELLEQSLHLYRQLEDRRAMATVLHHLGQLAYFQNDYIQARARYEESLAIWRELGDRSGIAWLLHNLAFPARCLEELHRARELAEASLAIRTELDDRTGLAHVLVTLGEIALKQTDIAAAQRYFARGLALFRWLGDPAGTSITLRRLGHLAWQEGDEGAAQVFHEESLALRRELGNPREIAQSLIDVATLALERAEPLRARALYQEALALHRELGSKRGMAHSLWHLGRMAFLAGDFTAANSYYEECLALRQQSGNRAEVAHSLCDLGTVALAQRRFGHARTLYQESLSLYAAVGYRPLVIDVLGRLAHVTLLDGEPARAVRLLAAVETLGDGDPIPGCCTSDNPAVCALGHGLDEAALAVAWAEGSAMSMEEAVAHALGKTRLPLMKPAHGRPGRGNESPQ